MSKKHHSVRRMVTIALVSVTAYLAAVSAVAWLVSDRAEVRELMGRLDLRVLPVALALQFTSLGIMTARWMTLLKGTDPVPIPFRQALGIQLAAHSCNVVLPMLGGDLAASWILRRRQGVPYARSLTASIYARFAGLLTCAVLATLTTGLLLGEGISPDLLVGLRRTLLVVGAAAGSLLVLSHFPRPLLLLGARLERWSKRREGSDDGRLGAGLMLLAWWLHTTATRDRPWVLGSLAWSVLNYAALAASLMVMAMGLGINPRPLATLALVTASSLAGLTTIIAPGGGLAEELAMFALTQELLRATVTSAAAVVVAYGFLRAAVVALGTPAVVYYLRSARREELSPLWQADPGPILEQLRAADISGRDDPA